MGEKHTPGWEVSHEPPRIIIQEEGEIGKRCVAVMAGHYYDSEEYARLIAAAPELLAALEALLAIAPDNAEDEDDPEAAAAWRQAKAAVSSAKGGDDA